MVNLTDTQLERIIFYRFDYRGVNLEGFIQVYNNKYIRNILLT